MRAWQDALIGTQLRIAPASHESGRRSGASVSLRLSTILRRRPMSRVSVIAFLFASTLAFGALAQNFPGQLPDVSTYNGSMEQQRRDTESAAQVQVQNQPMQQRLDANYAAYAPKPGAGGGPPRMPPLKAKPL